jgi:hypothetical protein
MVGLAKFFDWRDALMIVKPETFAGWQRTAFKMFWRWKSRKPGRPVLPKDLRELVLRMARENATWGEGRIAHELSLKLVFESLCEPSANPWSVASRAEARPNVGQPSFETMRRRSSPATFSFL